MYGLFEKLLGWVEQQYFSPVRSLKKRSLWSRSPCRRSKMRKTDWLRSSMINAETRVMLWRFKLYSLDTETHMILIFKFNWQWLNINCFVCVFFFPFASLRMSTQSSKNSWKNWSKGKIIHTCITWFTQSGPHMFFIIRPLTNM